MNFREEFNLSIRARCAVLYVTTREEERLLSVVKDCAAELENMRVVSWDFASGFDVGVAVGKGNPIAVLDFIAKEPADTPILYVLKDFHRFLEDNMVCRMVKNLAAQLKPQQKSILIVSPVYKVPEELTSSVSVLEFQLPTLPELTDENLTVITVHQTESGKSVRLTKNDEGWVSGGKALPDGIEAIETALAEPSFDKCFDYDPSPDAAPLCGLDAPTAVITLAYVNTVGTEATVTLTLGTLREDGTYYATLNDETTVYLLAQEKVASLLALL